MAKAQSLPHTHITLWDVLANLATHIRSHHSEEFRVLCFLALILAFNLFFYGLIAQTGLFGYSTWLYTIAIPCLIRLYWLGKARRSHPPHQADHWHDAVLGALTLAGLITNKLVRASKKLHAENLRQSQENARYRREAIQAALKRFKGWRLNLNLLLLNCLGAGKLYLHVDPHTVCAPEKGRAVVIKTLLHNQLK